MCHSLFTIRKIISIIIIIIMWTCCAISHRPPTQGRYWKVLQVISRSYQSLIFLIVIFNIMLNIIIRGLPYHYHQNSDQILIISRISLKWNVVWCIVGYTKITKIITKLNFHQDHDQPLSKDLASNLGLEVYPPKKQQMPAGQSQTDGLTRQITHMLCHFQNCYRNSFHSRLWLFLNRE